MNLQRARRALVIVLVLTGTAAGPATAAIINGTSGSDVLQGTAEADTIRGYAGADRILGRAGADKIYGGDGADRLFPGDDSRIDVLRGGPGPDRIFARTGQGLGPDENVIGRDYVYAGPGNDLVKVVESWGWYLPFLDCGPGHDTVVVPHRMVVTKGCEHLVLPTGAP
jgi:Ca2+-binding RTX toxin-like protein